MSSVTGKCPLKRHCTGDTPCCAAYPEGVTEPLNAVSEYFGTEQEQCKSTKQQDGAHGCRAGE